MIIEVVGKEIEKIKGDYESYLNGLNMVGEISYSQYSELYDEGTKQIQKAYELGKAEKNTELENKIAEIKANCDLAIEGRNVKIMELEKENKLLGERCNQLLADKGKLTDELDKWKSEWQEQVQKATDEGYARTKQTIQLSKVKELIEDMYDKIPASHSDYYKDVMERARQFLSEVEK